MGYIIVLSICGMGILLFGYVLNSFAIVTISHVIFIMLYYVLLLINKRKILAQPLYLVPIIASVYAITWPLLKYVLNWIPAISFCNEETELIGTLFYCVFIQFFCLLTAFHKEKEQLLEDQILLAYRRTRNNIFVELLMWGFTILVLSIYLKMGGFALASNGVNRELVNAKLGEIPCYSFLTYMFSAATIYLAMSFLQTKGTAEKLRHVPGLLCSLIFYFIQLQIGNRRELIYVCLGIAIYFGLRYGNSIKLRWILIAIAAVSSLLVVSVVRTYGSLANVPNTSFLFYTLLGEFINPTVTLYCYIESNPSLTFGASLLLFLPMLIPRFLWPGKPSSLAVTFVEDFNMGIGYGFSPATEAFINFSYLGCIIHPLILFALISYVSRNCKKHPYLFLALYLQLINIFRGEFSSSMIEIIVFAFTFWCIGRINSSRYIWRR